MNYHKNIMLICLDLNKHGYKFMAPVLKCKSNDELQIILNRLNCLKRTIEKYDKDVIATTENYEIEVKNLIQKQEEEKQELEKQIEELKKQLDQVHEIEKNKLNEKHEKDVKDVENLKITISSEIEKMNEDFTNMNKQTEENILLEDEYEKLCC